MRTFVYCISLLVVLVSSIVCYEDRESAGNSSVPYEPEVLLAKIFSLNGTTHSRSKFEEDIDNKFDGGIFQYDSPGHVHYGHGVMFLDQNRVGKVQKKRRRKPRVQLPQGYAPEYLGPYAPGAPHPGGDAHLYYGSAIPGHTYRPSRRQRPSLASEALSSVTEALTSIALFDDRQCVARLLCEAAAGGALGSTGALQSVAGLQPLLTLLSAYSGISSNPLFVFGRAAFLGISSKNNPASCRYAYPLCPTDPEQLVYYLNNHNGGFFRFFNAPQKGQQNIQQFYDHLSQNYDIYQQSNGVNFPNQQNQIQHHNLQNYGTKYPYGQNQNSLTNNIRFKNDDDSIDANKIEKRIQNKPAKYLDDFEDDPHFDLSNEHNTKWSFPEANNVREDSTRVGKGVKFPENSYTDYNIKAVENKRDPRGFIFPDTQSSEYLDLEEHQEIDSFASNNYYYNNYNMNSDIYKGYNDNHNGYDKDQSIRTIYVVRGNGDPNHPEIIKLRPGQTVY